MHFADSTLKQVVLQLCCSQCDVWVHLGGDHRVIRGVPLEGDCGDIYRVVSQVLECPQKHFYLSNGVKILLPGHALKCYATHKNIAYGLHIDCFFRCVGGNGSGDEGEC